MSDNKAEENQASHQPEKVSIPRRKLTTAALAGPVVLGTLASRQALGQVPYMCTVSGLISNNFSPTGHSGGSCGGLGLSPGCWKQNNTIWPSGSPARSTKFVTTFCVEFYGATLIQVICPEGYGKTVSGITNPIPNGAPNAGLARAGVASLLNAYKAGAISSHDAYPVTVSEVIAMVKSALQGNDTVATQTGGRVTTLQYLTSLYGGTSSSPDSGTTTGCPKGSQTLTLSQKCLS